jgi:membrane fusion protein (multidrug efflux system)
MEPVPNTRGKIENGVVRPGCFGESCIVAHINKWLTNDKSRAERIGPPRHSGFVDNARSYFPSMNWLNGLALRLTAALALAVVVLTAAGCKKAAPPPPPPPIVQVMEVTATSVPLHTEFIGQLDSPQNVEVRARVEAFVDKVLFIEGSEVKLGDPLFALDKKPFEEKLAAANGMLAEANAALNKYKTDVARLKPLAAKRAIPQQDLDNAVASVDVGEANVLSAKARVVSAEIDLGYCDVKAPLDGMIGAKQVSVGSLVGKGEPTLLATISQLDPIWFYCNVSEAQYLRGQAESRRTGKNLEDLPVTLILTTGAAHPAKGKIVFLDRAVDVKTGTLRMRAAFPNPEKLLRPGMFARMKVDIGVRPDSILVPERAVTELQGKNFVWAVDADNKATQRAVKVGETIGENVLIEEGLKAGERIITEGLQKVREGAPVQPKTAAQMAEAAAQAEASHAKPGETKPGKE